MANPGSIIGQITEEFEQLGKQVVKEVVKAPKDIGEKALESLGTSSGKQQGKSAKVDETIKKATARAALEELAGNKPKPKELSVREKTEAEEKQKKELVAQQQKQAQQNQLQQTTSKRKRGDLFGVQAKRSSAERKNVRQD